MLIGDVYDHAQCVLQLVTKRTMEDLKVLALQSLVKQAASQLGYPIIKPRQLEAVVKFVQGRDVLVSLPTSYGKTLMPSLHNTISDHQSSIDIVLSPLVALIAEQ